MPSILAALVLAFAISACASGAGEPTSGISGSVTAGPTCPVETAISPCPPGVWTGTVRATASDGTNYEAKTDAQGHYRISVPPGTYAVIPIIEGPGPPSASPASVTVTADAPTTLDLQVDTGIR
jgi:hypothetical protein